MKRVRRAMRRRNCNKYLSAGFAGLLACGTTLTPLLEGHVSTWVFVGLTAVAFILAGISHLVGDDD